MVNSPKSLVSILWKRGLCATPKANFKFVLTEEMSKQYEQKVREEKAAQEVPEQALHTQQSPLIMARVSHDRYRNVIKVAVPKHRFNKYIVMYIREADDLHVLDEQNLCSPGDWVLLRRTDAPIDEKVQHKVERVVYKYGNYIDPLSGRRSLGIYYDDDMRRLEKIKLEV